MNLKRKKIPATPPSLRLSGVRLVNYSHVIIEKKIPLSPSLSIPFQPSSPFFLPPNPPFPPTHTFQREQPRNFHIIEQKGKYFFPVPSGEEHVGRLFFFRCTIFSRTWQRRNSVEHKINERRRGRRERRGGRQEEVFKSFLFYILIYCFQYLVLKQSISLEEKKIQNILTEGWNFHSLTFLAL